MIKFHNEKAIYMKQLRALILKVVPILWIMRVRLAFQDFNKTPPILIFQMGKVASSAVHQSLKKAGLANPIHHAHRLSYTNLDEAERYRRSVGTKSEIATIQFWRKIRRKLDKVNKPIHIISLVRDPVALQISGIFQNIESHRKLIMADSGEIDVERTVDFLRTLFANYDEATDYVCTWFDKEMLDTFGIDVYATPFDHSRGFSIIANDRAKLLLLRMEDLSGVFSEALREFMGLSVPLVRSNESATKGYSKAYKSVLNTITLPMTAAEKIYTSRHAQHFYTEEERKVFIKKWTADKQHAQP